MATKAEIDKASKAAINKLKKLKSSYLDMYTILYDGEVDRLADILRSEYDLSDMDSPLSEENLEELMPIVWHYADFSVVGMAHDEDIAHATHHREAFSIAASENDDYDKIVSNGAELALAMDVADVLGLL